MLENCRKKDSGSVVKTMLGPNVTFFYGSKTLKQTSNPLKEYWIRSGWFTGKDQSEINKNFNLKVKKRIERIQIGSVLTSNLFASDLSPCKMTANNFLRKLSDSVKKTYRCWRDLARYAIARARGQARRGEAKRSGAGYKSVLRSLTAGGRWSASIQGQPLRRSRRLFLLSLSSLFLSFFFLQPLLHPSLSFTSSALASFPSPFPLLRVSFLALPLPLLKSAVSAIRLNSESKRGIFYSLVSTNIVTWFCSLSNV